MTKSGCWLCIALALCAPVSLAQEVAPPSAPAPPAPAPPAPASPAPASPAPASPAPLAPQPASAGQPLRTPVYSLRRCIVLAESNYPKVQEARARLGMKRAQQWQSRTAPYSDFTATAGLGIAPALQGTPIYSRDNDVPISDDMALAWQVGIEGLVPLWTFGKITNLWDAADAQVSVGENEVRKEKNDLRLSVRRAYYGVMLARDGLLLVREAQQRIAKYLGRLETKVRDGEGDEIELLKLRIQHEDLVVRESEARKQGAIGLAGLRFLTGISSGVDVENAPLRRLPHQLGPLAHYLSAARLYRPEINMARAGVLAREAQLRAERAKFFPDLGLALGVRWMNASEVTDQRNPFARDVGHGRSLIVGLALRYKLDLLPQAARYAQAEAQLEEIRATERYALGGVGFEVEQAFRDAEDAAVRLEAHTRAVAHARKWLIQVQQGIDVGTFDDEDIVDPAREFALKRFAQMSATLDYNMALARLAQATGWDAIAAE